MGETPHDGGRSAPIPSNLTSKRRRREQVPKVSKDGGKSVDHGPVVDCSGELDNYTVNFVSFRQDIDATTAAEGLARRPLPVPALGLCRDGARPGTGAASARRCSRRATRSIYRQGIGPIGSDPEQQKIIQFSPTDQLREVEAVMTKNMKAMTAHWNRGHRARAHAEPAAVLTRRRAPGTPPRGGGRAASRTGRRPLASTRLSSCRCARRGCPLSSGRSPGAPRSACSIARARGA